MRAEIERQKQERMRAAVQESGSDEEIVDLMDGGINMPSGNMRRQVPDFYFYRKIKDVLDDSVFEEN